ncbi:MAG: hypothetical protein FWC77_07000 [Defluviitaleaceae bacterium]|nr:hypothetical protein [Defluviitaleaceae bacterium]
MQAIHTKLFELRLWVFFFLLMGVALTVAAVRTHLNTANEIPIITNAAQFGEHYGQRVYVHAPVINTGISHSFRRAVGTRGRYETITWHLYLIQFEDAYVALRSRNSDLQFGSLFYVSVLRMPEDTIGAELLQRYSHTGTYISMYIARWAYRNLAFQTFAVAMVFLVVGIILGVVALRKRRQRLVYSDFV